MDKFIKEGDFNWLCLALKDDCIANEHFELIHVANGNAYATNGHRMHAAPCKLDDGVYCRYEIARSLDINNIPPVETDVEIPDGFKPQVVMIKQAAKAFNPASEVRASNFYVQNGFYGQLVPKDGSSKFQRIYVLEALFGMSTKGGTILHVHTNDDGENFMYANDGERSFIVMGMKLDKENDCE
ncbi:hypothetical protein I3252_05315 [Psychrobacter sp. Ps4]|uniref:hypothetical protein n=1 Tax=Psychrobacter sp. Ps4 TaxID=2790958 RepID=UPI001EDDD0A5|nr:hypothetical protein [Psychrobacter sp. Ps4]MCG3808902.1 hypothetical protein [Psychrobacter sp. Ps4]